MKRQQLYDNTSWFTNVLKRAATGALVLSSAYVLSQRFPAAQPPIQQTYEQLFWRGSVPLETFEGTLLKRQYKGNATAKEESGRQIMVFGYNRGGQVQVLVDTTPLGSLDAIGKCNSEGKSCNLRPINEVEKSEQKEAQQLYKSSLEQVISATSQP